ncbi:Alpha-1,3-mannosyltransferase CMT1 [Smittium mucronatum]|uniref:Alpha-1,3-mannosyltransferase CMT1 n=1 Tax=Smittium mucronatum TaxID=133383 RepID=A0A1R0GSY2_9FUNG|nr:Alpha-1,3-mannosyltransferase CMT1 [Smittium mucronatum]
MLRDFSNYMNVFDIKHTFVMENQPRPKIFHRIEYLAEIRNKALKPLKIERRKGRTDDVLELIYQYDFQESDFTCPLDFQAVKKKNNELEFRDSWVARDLRGEKFRSALDLLSYHPETRRRNEQKLPFQVQCSWNGVAILNPKPFYEKNPISFRRSYSDLGECSASECSLLCNDFWSRGYKRIVAVPEILVSYRLEDAILLDPVYDKALKVNRTLEEKIKYVNGPPQVICVGLDGNNRINPDQPKLWVNYTTSGTEIE